MSFFLGHLPPLICSNHVPVLDAYLIRGQRKSSAFLSLSNELRSPCHALTTNNQWIGFEPLRVLEQKNRADPPSASAGTLTKK